MNATSNQEPNRTTDHPPPSLPGLYSVQAVAAEPAGPDWTVYRKTAKAAAASRTEMEKRRRFSRFLLRQPEDGCGGYPPWCDPVDRAKDDAQSTAGESSGEIDVDRTLLTEEAREWTEDPGMSLLACMEEHAGASAADHSNFATICRRMIVEAEPDDLEEVCLFGSWRWRCRVIGVFANVANLSAAMQDIYLDRVHWINNGWPMVQAEHLDLLAERLAGVRLNDLVALTKVAAAAAGTGSDSAILKRLVCAPSSAKRRFARGFVDMMYEGVLFEPRRKETFAHDLLVANAQAIMQLLNRIPLR